MAAKKKKAKKVPLKKKKNISTHSIPAANPILHVRVSRFNPQMDFNARTHEYSIAPKEGESVLDLLTRLKHVQDGSLTFRGSCGYCGCGSCGVKANGKPVLGCVTQVKDVVDEHHSLRVDPLNEKNVIKDLVTDEKPFFDELLRVKPWIVSRAHDERRNHKMGVKDVVKLGNAQQCILCGLCNANADSSSRAEIGPAAFVKAYRYANDLRDGDVKRLSTLSTHFPPHYSLDKANLCPRNIAPGDKLKEMRGIQKAQDAKQSNGKRKT